MAQLSIPVNSSNIDSDAVNEVSVHTPAALVNESQVGRHGPGKLLRLIIKWLGL